MSSLVAGSKAFESNRLDGKTSDNEFISSKDNLTVGHNLARIERGIDGHIDASLSVLPRGLSDFVLRSPGDLCSSGLPYIQTARRLEYCQGLHFETTYCLDTKYGGQLGPKLILRRECRRESGTYLMHWLQLGSFLSQPFLMLLQWEHTCGARCKD